MNSEVPIKTKPNNSADHVLQKQEKQILVEFAERWKNIYHNNSYRSAASIKSYIKQMLKIIKNYSEMPAVIRTTILPNFQSVLILRIGIKN